MRLRLFDLMGGEKADPKKVDGELYLRAGGLRINFFYVFMDHVGFKYPDELMAALNNKFDNQLRLFANTAQQTRNLLVPRVDVGDLVAQKYEHSSQSSKKL